MTESLVWHVAVALGVPRVAAGFFKCTVQIWDFESGKRLNQLETILDFGGKRLVMSNDGSSCVAAAWGKGTRGGVRCYDIESGVTLWHRLDLAETQYVLLSADGTTVWWMPDRGPLLRLDATTGRTIEALKGICRVFESRYSTLRLLQRRRGGYVLEGAVRVPLPQETFAPLDAAFAPTALCISEVGSAVRCFSADGTECWRYDPGRGAHVLHLWYGDRGQSFYGVRYDYRNGGHRLLAIDPNNGVGTELTDLTEGTVDAAPEQDRLITADGGVYELSSGTLIARLDFPRRERST